MLIRLWHQTPADFQVSPALYAPLLGLHGNEQYSDFKSLFLNNIGLANLLWQKIEQKRLDFMWHMPIFQCSWINHSVIWDFYLDFSFLDCATLSCTSELNFIIKISNSYLLIGAPGKENSFGKQVGAAYLFERVHDCSSIICVYQWNEIMKFTPPDSDFDFKFPASYFCYNN